MNVNSELQATHRLNDKRSCAGERNESRKKRKLMLNVRDFLDVEASEDESLDEEESENESSVPGFSDESDTSARDGYLGRGTSLTTPVGDGLTLDDRMTSIINRYEAAADAQDRREPGFENEEVAALAERFQRIPTDSDPFFWRVRVQDGSEEETFWTLQDRLRALPGLAYAIVLPPRGRMWIGVESISRTNVEELCKNLSTIRHPLEILLVPVNERVAESESTVVICLVPRLLVKNGIHASGDMNEDERKRPRRKRLPRLLHPKAIGDHTEIMEIAPRMDPNVWWQPGSRQELILVEDGIYRFAKERKGDNQYIPPFALFKVPAEALCSSGVTPRLRELKLFVEGMAIGSNLLDFPAPSREFIRWTYERYVAFPVEIGNRVEVDLKPGKVWGTIVDVRFDEVVVRTNDMRKEIQVDTDCLRRFYEIGDAVKVVQGSDVDREGWIVNVEDDELAVFNSALKEEFHVKTWQVVPHDNFEWRFPHKFQVGDVVRVNSPRSPHHGVTGKFAVPSWFLDLDKTPDSSKPGGSVERSCSSYDRYDELVNTWVVITGKKADKGLFGRIQKNLGNQIMHVEARSGAKVVDVHVDFLITAQDGGRDLRQYHVGHHHTPVFQGYSIPNFQRQPERPERATTPMPTPEEQVEIEETPEIPTMPSESTAPDSEVLPVNWVMKHGLISKQVYAHVCNTKPDPFCGGGGFAKGKNEGDTAMILSGEVLDEILVHIRKQTVRIPARFLFPKRPTSKGQAVVIISGEMAGETYVTRDASVKIRIYRLDDTGISYSRLRHPITADSELSFEVVTATLHSTLNAALLGVSSSGYGPRHGIACITIASRHVTMQDV
ncbi:hypothetical protein F5887DRAFT_1166918 [Amanita rubescens]|nr:hypothetical protein F5887DRAFT_1166918 [Amanita rubescens]